MLGMHGNIAPNMNTNACDVLIAIGMRFDDRVTGNLKTYARQAKIIHFDIDLAEMDKNVKTTVKVLGDAKATLPLVTELIGKRDHSAWLETFNQYRKREFDCVIKAELYPENGGELKMGEVINKVSEATGHKAICVTDVGQHQMMATRYFKSTLPRSMVTSGDWAPWVSASLQGSERSMGRPTVPSASSWATAASRCRSRSWAPSWSTRST